MVEFFFSFLRASRMGIKAWIGTFRLDDGSTDDEGSTKAKHKLAEKRNFL